MTIFENEAAAVANGATTGGTPTMSLFDAIAQAEDSGDLPGMVRISTDASFISAFTQDAMPVSAHYVPATETWDGI